MKIKFNSRFKDIYLMLTEFCPNRCEYCYIKHRTVRQAMSIETVDRVISSFEYENPRIIFFGGEPLVEISLMEEIMDKYPQCRYQVITSATVNFEKFINQTYPKYNIPEIQLSWDGASSTTRPTAGGNHLNDKVLQQIEFATQAGVQIDVKCVVNDTNVLNLVNTFKSFQSMQRVHGDFVIAHQKEFDPGFPYNFGDMLQHCLKLIADELTIKNHVYIPKSWMDKMLAVIIKDKSYCSCDAGNYIVVRPNGDLYPCTIFSQLETFCMGNIHDDDIDDEVINMIKTPCKHSDCQKCDIRYLCDGGCRFERYSDNWQNEYRWVHCKTTHIIADVLQKWMALGLNETQRTRLCSQLMRYQSWSFNYNSPRRQ